MGKNDDFDLFLKESFQKEACNIKDEGFTDKVISRLPAPVSGRYIPFKRNLILLTLSILSVLIFIISNGYKSLFNSFFDLYSNGLYLTKPSLISLVVISVFISVIFFITRIEHDRNTI
jgi:hypothetical protein